MKRVLQTLRILAVCLPACAIFSISHAQPIDPGEPDTLSIDSVHVVMPETAVVPVYFFNDEPLAAIEITLRHHSPFLVADSFSFAGGRAEYVEYRGFTGDDSTLIAYAFVSNQPLISPGSDLLGRMYLSYPDTTVPHISFLDTVTVTVDLIVHGNFFSDEDINSFVPQVTRGFISLQRTCCYGYTGNVDGDPENLVDIGDLTAMISYLYIAGSASVPCLAAANIDGDPEGVVDIGDLTKLIGYLYIDPILSAPAPCP